MKLVNFKKMWDRDVEKWLIDSIPELTKYQIECIKRDEIIRFAPFYFMERRKKVNNVWLRFSIILIPPVLLILIAGLPFNFFMTGRWGWNYDKVKWYSKWVSACGL